MTTLADTYFMFQTKRSAMHLDSGQFPNDIWDDKICGSAEYIYCVRHLPKDILLSLKHTGCYILMLDEILQ